MNYGRIEQGIKYRVVDRDSLNSVSCRFDSIAALDSSRCDSIDKLVQIFNHVDTIITADIDLNQMHEQLKTVNKNLAYFKSIVLVDRSDINTLIEILECDPEVKTGSTDEMNLHETFISEITTFGGFNEKEIKKILRGNESVSLSVKVGLVTKWINSKKKEENKEEIKEENKEESKRDQEDSEDEDPEENDPLTVYGIETHEKLESKVNELAAFDNNNFNMAVDAQNASKDDLYTKVYMIRMGDIHFEYTKTLATYYKQLCRSTISTFFNELAIEDILDIMNVEKEVTKKFISYVLMKGNEAAIIRLKSKDQQPVNDFMAMFTKLITVCSQKQKFRYIIDTLYSKSIVKNTKNLLIDSIKAGKDSIEAIYSNEAVSAKTMNVLLISDTLSQILKIAPDVINVNFKVFPHLISVLLLIAICFRKEFELQRTVYMLIYKILVPIAKSPKSYNPQLIEGLLRLKIFKKMIEKCNFDVTVLSGNKLTPEQKLLFEIYLLINKIDSSVVGTWSLYTYTDILLELSKCKEVLKEGKDFDMISYLIYFNNELSGPQQHTKVYADTYYNVFDCKISAKVHFDGFKKMTIRVDEMSKISDNTFIGISSDPDGESILKKISQKDITKDSTRFDIYSNQCFIHYPYNPPRIVGFGEGNDYKLGNSSTVTTSEPTEFTNFRKPIKSIKTRRNFTVALDADGQLYYSGYKTSFSNTNQTMTKYHKKLPTDTIVRIETGSYNVIALTDTGKFYCEGSDYLYQFDSYSTEKYDFWYKQRPDEETESVIDFDAGNYYHLYITDNGKLYGAGNTFLSGLNLNNDSKDYKQIPLPEDVTPKRVRCSESGDTPKSALVFVEVGGKSQLWSGGSSVTGMLGQGNEVTASTSFKVMSYDTDTIEFIEAELGTNHAMAITSNGELYAWGSNNSYQ